MTPDERLYHSQMGKGRYSNLSASQVSEKDPSYLVWAYEAWNPKPCSKLLYDECRRDVGEAKRQRLVERDQDE